MEFMKKAMKIVKDWIISLVKACWTEYLKDKVHAQVEELIRQGVNMANIFYKSKDYEFKRNYVIKFVTDKIKLPIALKPFKWVITKVMRESIDNEIEKLLDKLNKTH